MNDDNDITINSVVEQLNEFGVPESAVPNVGALFEALFPDAMLMWEPDLTDLREMPLPTVCGCACAQVLFAGRRFADLVDGDDGDIVRSAHRTCLVIING